MRVSIKVHTVQRYKSSGRECALQGLDDDKNLGGLPALKLASSLSPICTLLS